MFFKTLLAILGLTLFTDQARAAPCPGFYRFVDFGLDTPDGATRGGPTYRAESFAEEPLLIRDRTVCRDLRNVATDGRGNPIPVVTSISYDPEQADLDLTELRLTRIDDIPLEARENAAPHRARVARNRAVIRRGEDYLCASSTERTEISCQLVSPIGGNLAPVVYCDAVQCRMPVLALNERVIATATWTPSDAVMRDHDAVPSEIARKVQQIADFLAPLSSWRPDFQRFDQ